MEDREKYLGESLLSKQPEKKLILTLRDGSVTTDKIADKSVTPEKLSDDINSIITMPLINDARNFLLNKIEEESAKAVKSISINGTGRIFPNSYGNIDLNITTEGGTPIDYSATELNRLLAGAFSYAGLPLILPIAEFVDTINQSDISNTKFAGDPTTHLMDIVWDNSRNRAFMPHMLNDSSIKYFAVWDGVPYEMASSDAYNAATSGNFYYHVEKGLLTLYHWYDGIDGEGLVPTGKADKQCDVYTKPTVYGDLLICDEDDNVLARFRNGHFKVENFDSEQIVDKVGNLEEAINLLQNKETANIKFVTANEDSSETGVLYFIIDEE